MAITTEDTCRIQCKCIYLTILLFLFSAGLATGAEVRFTWAKSMGGSLYDHGRDVAADALGNVYITGSFQETADFDPGAGTSNLTAVGRSDIFIAKLDKTGAFIWAKQIGGTNNDYGQSLALDSVGNIHITGSFRGTVDFDPGPGTENLISTANDDIFICKLDTNGNFIWARGFGNDSFNNAMAVTVDSTGNVYTTGSFNNTVDFDPGPGTQDLTASPQGYRDIFVSKLNSQGDYVWAKSMGGIGSDIGHSLAVDSTGNVYTTGYFQGTADFDPDAGIADLSSNGDEDIFISKLNSDGSYGWAYSMGGSNRDVGNGIFLDSSTNILISGYFKGTVDFNPAAETDNLSAYGGYDAFVAKFNSSGSYVWAKNLGGSSTDYGEKVTVDAAGNVYSIGEFWQSGDFDPGAGTFTLTGIYSEVYISKLDSNGDFVWAKAIGGSNGDYGRSIFFDAANNLYIAGDYQETADFDPGSGNYDMTSTGGDDIYVVKFDIPYDFGDAPDPDFPSLLANDGAKHQLGGNLYLGSCVDAELDGQPNQHARGDDLAGGRVFGTCSRSNDEDGVRFTSALMPGETSSLIVTASEASTLDGWIDFNSDGDWADAGEQVFISHALTAGNNPLAIFIPPASGWGRTMARFRLSSSGGLNYTGVAVDGEVEDYRVVIGPPFPWILMYPVLMSTQ